VNTSRRKVLDAGLSALPKVEFPSFQGRNGEELATDEAAVWKRVINYRVASYIQPRIVLETHRGYGISSVLYLHASPLATLLDHNVPLSEIPYADIADIDPFGQPWDTISKYRRLLTTCQAVFVSNGEALLVIRNLRKAQRYPTDNFGTRIPHWVVNEYIPRLEATLNMPCRFFYVFPSTVRSIHSQTELPCQLFTDCPQWMWWLSKYVPALGGG
jgi:hypothetical protein